MTAHELRRECAGALLRGVATLTLVTPRGFKAPKGFPRGELLTVNKAGESVRRVRLAALVSWMDRTGGLEA